MIYALVGASIVSVVLALTLALTVRAQRGREDRLLDRIQAPQAFVAKVSPEPELAGHISAFDDEALAELERVRSVERLAT